MPATTILPVRQHFQVGAPLAILPRRHPREAAGVARQQRAQRRPSRERCTSPPRADRWWPSAMMLAHRSSFGELFPDVVVVSRQHRVRAVAEVRARLRAPALTASRICCAGRRGVADRDDDAGRRQLLDERDRPGALRRDRDHADAPAGRVLPAVELVPVRVADVLLRVRAARAVLAGQVRPFEVVAGNAAGAARRPRRRVRSRVAKPWRIASKLLVMSVGRNAPMPCARHVSATVRTCSGVSAWRVEADAEAAVDLRVEERRRDPLRRVLVGVARSR